MSTTLLPKLARRGGTLAIRLIERARGATALRRGVKAVAWSIFRFLLLFGLAFIILYPLLYMLSIAFRVKDEVFHPAIVWIPRTLTLENLKLAFRLTGYPEASVTTLAISVSSS